MSVNQLEKRSDTVWELPVSFKVGMRVPARIVGTEKLVREMDEAVTLSKLCSKGEWLELKRHQQRVDVKAVTLHCFQLVETNGEWLAVVILDI